MSTYICRLGKKGGGKLFVNQPTQYLEGRDEVFQKQIETFLLIHRPYTLYHFVTVVFVKRILQYIFTDNNDHEDVLRLW